MHARLPVRVLALAAALVAAACINTSRTSAVMLSTAATARPKISADAVRVYRTADQVPGRYEEVALLNSEDGIALSTQAQMVDGMKEKAASLGANAIILESISEPSAEARVLAVKNKTPAERTGKAVAIYVLPDSAARR